MKTKTQKKTEKSNSKHKNVSGSEQPWSQSKGVTDVYGG